MNIIHSPCISAKNRQVESYYQDEQGACFPKALVFSILLIFLEIRIFHEYAHFTWIFLRYFWCKVSWCRFAYFRRSYSPLILLFELFLTLSRLSFERHSAILKLISKSFSTRRNSSSAWSAVCFVRVMVVVVDDEDDWEFTTSKGVFFFS